MEERESLPPKKETLEERSKLLCHDPDAALRCLLPAVCNTQKKLYMLRNLPFRENLDISVYYKIVIQPNAEYGRLDFIHTNAPAGTVTLTLNLLEEWGRKVGRRITEDELFDIAVANAKEAHRIYEPVYGHYGMNLSRKENIVPGNLYVSTNALGWLGGADAFLGIGIEEMAEANQSDIYIVPTSIHESILVPADDSTTPEDVAGICMGDGPFEKGSETWLSDNVYRYDRVSKEISVVYDAEAIKLDRMDGMKLLFGPNYGVKAPRRGR